MDPDQDRYSVGPDLCPNCLQRLSADNILLSLAVQEFISSAFIEKPVRY